MSAGLLDVIWATILSLAVFAYVVMDGFDLGIGMLFPFFKDGKERDDAINSIAPFWDGNETWLVLGGGGLLAAFPLAYAIILPATYPPIIAMLVGLILRGVAFEFRWRNTRHRPYWDAALSMGSFLAAVAQGTILGAVLQGIKVDHTGFAGGSLDWLSAFSVLSGVALGLGYCLLGATRLVWKTSEATLERARGLCVPIAVATLVGIAAISAATPFLHPQYSRRWLEAPAVFYAAQVPLLVFVISVALFVSLRRRAEKLPFFAVLALFFVTFVGLGISVYPYVVPTQVTIWDAAAPAVSLAFMLAGTALILPLIVAYNVWAHWVFRGKVASPGYHP